MASSADDDLEIGCLSVRLVAARNIKIGAAGMVDILFGTQLNPYCKISLGETETTSVVGVKTTSGHAWNREQMFFPVKIPRSCVIGATGCWDPKSRGSKAEKKGAGASASAGGIYNPPRGRKDGRRTPSSKATRARAAEAADASPGKEMRDRLTLRARMFHRKDKGEAGKAGTPATAGRGPTKGGSARDLDGAGAGAAGVGDRLVAECSLNLMDVICGRAPHVEEWVPLDTGGELRLSLDYDTVEDSPAPGKSGSKVGLICLSNRLDFFPLPVVSDEDPVHPGSPFWLWGNGASARRSRAAAKGATRGFRVEKAGDDFILLSYRTPEGWRCAVEVHRFLVYVDSTTSSFFSISGLRDRAFSIPACSALRDTLLLASREDSSWVGLKKIALQAKDGLQWTLGRWWRGGLRRIRNDVLFAVGLTDLESSDETFGHVAAGQGVGDGDGAIGQKGLAGGVASPGGIVEGQQDETKTGRELSPGEAKSRAAEDTSGGDSADGAISAGVSPGGWDTSIFFKFSRADDEQPRSAVSLDRVSKGTASKPSLRDAPSAQQNLCPITRCPIEDPAVAADGYTYERAAIERWLSEHDTSPVTGEPLETKTVFKNWLLASSQSF